MEEFHFPPVSAGLDVINPLSAGEMGVVMAKAGVGKTAFLCLLALEEISRGGRVLHICVDETPDKIRTWYEEILRAHGKNYPRAMIKELASRIDSLRFIASFLHNSFSLQRLQELTTNLIEQAKFNPTLFILDGLDVERFDFSFFASLKTFLGKIKVPMWMSARIHQLANEKAKTGIPSPCDSIDSLLDVVVLMEHGEQGMTGIRVLKNRADFPENLYVSFSSPVLK